FPGWRSRGVKRGRQRALLFWNWGRRGAPPRPDPLQEGLRRNTRSLFSTRGQLLDFALQLRVAGTLGEQRLVDAQRILLMTLLEVQLRHGLREHRLGL